MNERHPEDLLAAYVDDELTPADRRAVESHVASCTACANELALARRAVAALSAVEYVPAPAGLATPAIQRARPEARWVRRLGWAAAGTAAAAVIALFTVGQLAGLTPLADRADGPAEVRGEAGDDADAGAAPAEALFLETDEDYSAEEVGRLVRRDADGEDAFVLQAGQETDGSYGLDSPRAKAAIECIERAGLRGDETTSLLRIEAARFEGKPAYIVVLRRGEETFEVWVVDRRTCGILHVANSS